MLGHTLQAAQVAALQQRLQEVLLAHRHALDDCEALRVSAAAALPCLSTNTATRFYSAW